MATKKHSFLIEIFRVLHTIPVYVWLLLFAGVIAGAVGITSLVILRSPDSTPVMRGYRTATLMGCFACHGPEGLVGAPNLGAPTGKIPPFKAGGAWMVYVNNDQEIREWILYGIPRRLQKENSSSEHKPSSNPLAKEGHGIQLGLIKMPAYEGLMSESELEDLIAYVKHAAHFEKPASVLAMKGRKLAHQLGCFGCHGEAGQGGISNPGSFKGFIPPWDGEDFSELVQNQAELEAWILDGKIERLESNPLASYFTHGQVIQMPAYKEVLKEGEIEALVAYFKWIRQKDRKINPYWVEPNASFQQNLVERGEWLYQDAGCAACHGVKGDNEVINFNSTARNVPILYDMAEKVALYEAEEVAVILAELEKGNKMDDLVDPPVSYFEEFLEQYHSFREIVLKGKHAQKKDPNASTPPIHMPSWSQRTYADGGQLQKSDIDAIFAYLLTLQPWEEDEEEEKEG